MYTSTFQQAIHTSQMLRKKIALSHIYMWSCLIDNTLNCMVLLITYHHIIARMIVEINYEFRIPSTCVTHFTVVTTSLEGPFFMGKLLQYNKNIHQNWSLSKTLKYVPSLATSAVHRITKTSTLEHQMVGSFCY